MESANATFLINLITPAVGIAILAYLTKFFGRIISDQNPFSDNKEWEVELAGINFMISLSIGALGISSALYWLPWGVNNWWEHTIVLAILFLVSEVFLLSNLALSGEFFKLKQEKMEKPSEYKRWVHNVFLQTGRHIPHEIPSVILFYIATVEYQSGNILWIIVIWSLVFFTLMQMAYNYSLRKFKRRTPVDIYFTDNSESLKSVMILKVNPDNMRIRTNDHRILIINKSLIAKVDMLIPEDLR